MGLPSFFKEKKVLIIIIIALVAAGVAAFLFLGGSEPAEEEEVAVSTRVTIQAPEVPVQPQEITTEKEGEVAVPAPAPVSPTKPSAVPAPPVKEVKKEVKEAPKAEVKAKPAKEKKRVSTAKKPSFRPWVINVASFSTKAQADELKSALKKDGYKVYSTEFFKDGVKWQRVRVGFYKTEAEAKRVSKKIASSYKLAKPWVVRPAKSETAKYMK